MSSGQTRGRGNSPARGARGDRGNRGQGGGGPPRPGQSAQLSSRPANVRGDIYLGSAPVPDPTITDAENELVEHTKGRTFDGFTGRRGYGTQGRKIVLRTNYFKIDTPFDSNDSTISEKTLYRYEVDVAGTQLPKAKRRQLLEKIVSHSKFNNIAWATDYSNIIVTTKKLDLGNSNRWEEKVTLPPPGERGDSASNNTAQGAAPNFVQAAQARARVTFRVTYSDSFSLQPLINYLRSRSAGAEYDARVDVIQLLNIIVCKHPQGADNIVNVGQNKFYPIANHPAKELFEIGGGLEALRGYYTSVRSPINRLLLNVNVTSGAFYKPIGLFQLVQESGANTLEKREEFIKGLKVKVTYKRNDEATPSKTKIATVRGIAKVRENGVWRSRNTTEVTFQYTDPSTPNATPTNISIYNYFRNLRGITLANPKWPVVIIGNLDKPTYLPVEICTVLAGQPYKKMLGGNETGEMIKFAARYPNQNAMSIAGTQREPGNGLRLFRLAAPPPQDMQLNSVKQFGFGVNTEMITVPGRILQGPSVNYGNNNSPNIEKASWNCARQKFAIPGRLGKWQALMINGNVPEAVFSELEKQLRGYDITWEQRVPTQKITLDPPTIENRPTNDRQIRSAFEKAQNLGVRLLFIVLPAADRWLYARIKFHGDVEFGIHSINAVGSKFLKPQGQAGFMGNLALKFNVKAGGVTHKVPGLLSKPVDNNTMLFGMDVTHPSPGSSPGAPSIAAVVANVDEHLFQWPGSIRTQTGRVEMVQGLKEMVLERLRLWHKKHSRLPNKIIIYRDGVSDGQYGLVLEHELPPFQQAFKEAYGQEKNWPKVAIIIVGKRHHTRFYPTSKDDADTKSWNPLPGTVVDRGIVGPIVREFYLQAHQGMQGTARPAHYVVIKDDISFEADELEQFTHKMCYTFNRATKAVSICPPAYYADLLAERGRAYLFSTLAENHDDNSTAYSATTAEWTGGVHPRLAESTWYI